MIFSPQNDKGKSVGFLEMALNRLTESQRMEPWGHTYWSPGEVGTGQTNNTDDVHLFRKRQPAQVSEKDYLGNKSTYTFPLNPLAKVAESARNQTSACFLTEQPSWAMTPHNRSTDQIVQRRLRWAWGAGHKSFHGKERRPSPGQWGVRRL